MPVQTWTPQQVLSALELTSVTNMLLYPVATLANVNPCVAGNYYVCTGTLTMSLPVPTVGTVIGFKLRGTSGSVNVVQHSSDVIYGPMGLNGVANVTLTTQDASIVLVGDGTNWQVTSMVGYNPLKVRMYASGAQNITSSGTTLSLNQIDGSDPTGMANTGTHTVTVAYPGFYVVDWNVKVGPAAGNTRFYTSLNLTGANQSVLFGSDADINATFGSSIGTEVVKFNAGGTVVLTAATSSASAPVQIDGPGQSNYMSVHFLSGL